MSEKKSGANTYMLAAIGVMSAFAFISNYLSIPIGDITRIHMGNGFCVLGGLLLGPIAGGLCGGIGAFFFDLTNPLYANEAIITFFTKFVIGFVAGLVAKIQFKTVKPVVINSIAAIAGSFSYVVVYMLKSFIKEYYFLKNPMETVLIKLAAKLGASVFNAVTAVIVAMILYPVFVMSLRRSGILDKIQKKLK
ncbi:MAG: ECF transporter S component [Oscillospiraceae bacterium]